MRPLPVVFVLLGLLLAGCVSDHSEHSGARALLFGVTNATNETLEVGWTVTVGEPIVWVRSERLEVGQAVERIQPLDTSGRHDILLSWGADRSAAFSYDTADCRGTFHLVVGLEPDGSVLERTRECHE